MELEVPMEYTIYGRILVTQNVYIASALLPSIVDAVQSWTTRHAFKFQLVSRNVRWDPTRRQQRSPRAGGTPSLPAPAEQPPPVHPRKTEPHEPNFPASCVTTVPAYPPLLTPTRGLRAFPRHKSTASPFPPSPTPPQRFVPRRPRHSLCLALPPSPAAEHGAAPPPPPRSGIVAALLRGRRGGDGGRELGQGGEQPAEPTGGGATSQAARHNASQALRHGADRPTRARQQRHQGRRRTPQRAGGRGRAPALLRARLGAPQRGGLLPGHADPGRRRGERGLRLSGQRHLQPRRGHDQRARRAGAAQHGQGRQGVLPHRAHGARGILPAVRRRVPGGAGPGRDEANARLPGPDGVLPHGERLPILRLRGERGRHLPRLRALPPQRRRARRRQRPQVLQPPRRAARRRLYRRRQAGQLQRRARGGLRDRVALQGRRQGGRRRRRQRRGLQRQPRPPRALRQRRHPAPPRRRRRRLPLRALQREPEARPDLRAQLRRVLPQPAAGVRRPVRPRRQLWKRQGQRRRPWVAGQRQEQQCRPGSRRRRRRRGEGDGVAGGGVVRGERDGGRGEAQGRAGLCVRARRRGLQGHPARRGVLRSQHHGLPRLLRLQRLLPAQGPLHRHLRLRRRRLRRQPGTKDGQVRAPLHGLKQSNKQRKMGKISHAGRPASAGKEGRDVGISARFLSLSLPLCICTPAA